MADYFSPSTLRNLVDTLEPGRSYRGRRGGDPRAPNLNLVSLPDGNGSARSSGPNAQAAVAQSLAKIANRTPEAVIKITGKQGDAQHLRANLAYISRSERDPSEHVDLENERGEKITDPARVREISEEWAAHANAGDDRRKGAVSRSMVLSSPRGSNPEKVMEAARSWAEKELGERRYLMALHTDTPNPHVHITYAIRDNNMVRSYPNRELLAKQREAWARELRERGIEVIATPRKARGVVQEKESTAQRRERERGDSPDRAASRYLAMMAKQRDATIAIFRQAITDLSQSRQADAPEIAKSLSVFVKGLEADAQRDRGNRDAPDLKDRTATTEAAPVRDERSEEIASQAGTGRPPAQDRTPVREAQNEADKAAIVTLEGVRIDTRELAPDQAEYIKELAEKERQENTVTLEGVPIDLRQLPPDQAVYVRELAEKERAERAQEQAKADGERVASANAGDARSADAGAGLRPENAEKDRDGPSEWAKELERQIRERERDRGGPSR